LPYILSKADRAAYFNDGVVCLRGVIPNAKCAELLNAAIRYMEHGTGISSDGRITQTDMGGRYFVGNFVSNADPYFRAFALSSELPPVAMQIVATRQIRFFFDQIILSEPGTGRATPWHNDLPFWPFDGEDIVSLWVALTPVTQDSAPVQYLAGSHNDGILYQTPQRTDPTLTDCPNFSDPVVRGNRRILSWEMNPGDVIAHHPLTAHGSLPNTSRHTLRCGLSVRYLGKNVRYHPRPSVPVALPYNCTPGQYPADDDMLPLAGTRI
jgi:ectoine hydroxylase-related dioxygenase (phytanoyl-CoA dioxygenase family)